MTDSPMSKTWLEPRVKELLDDPIAQLLMQKDGVNRDMLDPLIEDVTLRVQQEQEVA